MKLFGYTLIKQKELDKNFQDYVKLHTDNMVGYQEQYDEGFKKGVQHVINQLKTAVEKENINHVWKISHPNMDNLKFLANALLGTYAKRKKNG
jgi:hypothetical protein